MRLTHLQKLLLPTTTAAPVSIENYVGGRGGFRVIGEQKDKATLNNVQGTQQSVLSEKAP